jgi:hypothetical protein
MRPMRRALVVAGLALALADGAPAAEFIAQAKDFRCLDEWTPVPGRRLNVFHKNPKKLQKALRIARENQPRQRYPVGTIVQTFPFEAMVKRGGGFNPTGGGWEFFLLRATPEGTKILGRTEDEAHTGKPLRNDLGACQDRRCHGSWRAKRFDLVCEGHLPWFDMDEALFQMLRQDPRCPPPQP